MGNHRPFQWPICLFRYQCPKYSLVYHQLERGKGDRPGLYETVDVQYPVARAHSCVYQYKLRGARWYIILHHLA